MTKIAINEGSFAETVYGNESEESGEIRADHPNTAGRVWPKVRSKRITQVLGSGIVLLLIFWAAYIIVSSKKIDTVDVITFELTIVVIICFAIAAHLRRTSVR